VARPPPPPPGRGEARLLSGPLPGRLGAGTVPAPERSERLAAGVALRGPHRRHPEGRAERGSCLSRLPGRLQDRLLRMLAGDLSLLRLVLPRLLPPRSPPALAEDVVARRRTDRLAAPRGLGSGRGKPGAARRV